MRMFKGLFLLPLALVLFAPVHATTPTMVTGTISQVGPGTITDMRQADGTLFFTDTVSDIFTGGIQGQVKLTFNAIETSTSLTANGEGTFTGTANGSQSGTASVHITISVTVVAGTATSLQGQILLGDGSVGLVGLHAQGTIQGQGNGLVTYSELVHFDPA